jgi:hypothetical protein
MPKALCGLSIAGSVIFSLLISIATSGTSVAVQSDVTSISIEPIPLPAALPLVAAGLSAMGILSWRKKRKAHLIA